MSDNLRTIIIDGTRAILPLDGGGVGAADGGGGDTAHPSRRFAAPSPSRGGMGVSSIQTEEVSA